MWIKLVLNVMKIVHEMTMKMVMKMSFPDPKRLTNDSLMWLRWTREG